MNKRIEEAIKRFDRQQGSRYGYRCYPKEVKALSDGRRGKKSSPTLLTNVSEPAILGREVRR
jgi:UDP-glucose 6-dehydrogenase